MPNPEKISILVTGVGGASIGEGMIKTLRLSSTPYRIVAADALPISFGFFDADSHYQIPMANADNFLEKIFEICKKENIKVVIPGCEPDLKKMSDNRELFQKEEILLLVNTKEVIDLCTDKWATYSFLKENGFLCPDSYLIESEEQLSQVFDELVSKMPLIIKPVRGGGSSVNAFIAQDREELSFFIPYLLRQGLIPLIQEYIGTPHEEYTVGVLTTLQGKFMGSIALKRQILSGLSSKLKIKNRHREKVDSEILAISSGYSQGTIDYYKDVCMAAEKVALKLNSKGPINIQGRKTQKGFCIFEINPRFSGTTVMRAMVGFNEPDILIRQEILKEEISSPITYKTGVIPRGLREKYIGFDDVKNVS